MRAPLPRAGRAGRQGADQDRRPCRKPAALARIEARQFALVDRLTRFANHRADSAAAAIRKLGLDPHRMADSADDARGGPFEQLSTERNGSLHPRFERLSLAFGWKRWSAGWKAYRKSCPPASA